MMEFENIKDELQAVVDTGLKFGRSLSKDVEFEIYVHYENKAEAKISQGVVTAKDGAVAGTAVRVSKGKRVGFACASGITAGRVKLCVQEALSIVDKIKVEDERFKGFLQPKGIGKEGAFHKDILSLGIDDLTKAAQDMTKDAEAVDERVNFVGAEASFGWGAYAVGNTLGVNAATKFGYNAAEVQVQAMVGEERKETFDFDVARDRLFSIEGLGKKVAEETVALLGAKKLDYTGTMTTVWDVIPAACYVLASLAKSVVGQPVVEGISPLCDMIGDVVGPKDLTLVDDGQNPLGLLTNAIDAEGHPQQRNPIIENGVLKGFLFDSYYATAYGVESTGNSDRDGGMYGDGAPYENAPRAQPKWLEISAGSKSEEDLIAEIDGRALFIKGMPLGIFHSSVATGEFSAVANCAYLIENGEKKHPIQPVSVSGQFYEGYKNLVGIGSYVVQVPFGVALPSLVFKEFSVTG
ncbi:MAG: TldD/PmbA family protein [Candidatus Thorarchaeota archaeon]